MSVAVDKKASWRDSGVKTCPRCKVEKPVEAFVWAVKRAGTPKVPTYCRPCANARSTEWAKSNGYKAQKAWDKRAQSPNRVCSHCKVTKPRTEFEVTVRRNGRPIPAQCKDCAAVGVTYSKEYYKRNSERIKASVRKYTYGITPEEFEAKRAAQENLCAICGEEFTSTPHLDHDHLTGEIRDLLCRGCNMGIGCLRESPETLKSAIEYLTRWGKQ